MKPRIWVQFLIVSQGGLWLAVLLVNVVGWQTGRAFWIGQLAASVGLVLLALIVRYFERAQNL